MQFRTSLAVPPETSHEPPKDGREIRTLPVEGLETREKKGDGSKIEGYAAVHEEFAEIMDWWGDKFFERFAKGAFDKTLGDGHDIFAIRNHNWDQLLGRTGQNLNLKSEDRGLFFELEPPNTTLGRDTMEEVRSGLIHQCSIGFRILDQEWEERDGDLFRTIKEVELFEITLTPIPAYTSTSAEVRNLKPGNTKKQAENTDKEQEERQAILAEANQIHEQIKK